jgi:hypothetical protein
MRTRPSPDIPVNTAVVYRRRQQEILTMAATPSFSRGRAEREPSSGHRRRAAAAQDPRGK